MVYRIKKLIFILTIIISTISFGQVKKIKVQKERSEAESNVNCPFVFLVDSSILNKKVKPATVFFSGRGYTKDIQKKFDEIKPFRKNEEYLITYKSIQRELKDFCNLDAVKILKVEIQSIGDSLFTVSATFGPK